jgi:hypothetical protein
LAQPSPQTLREATHEAVRRGVPRQAAIDFIIGHLNIELAIAFGVFPEGRFSDGAMQAISQAKPVNLPRGVAGSGLFAPGGPPVGQGHLPSTGGLTVVKFRSGVRFHFDEAFRIPAS